MCTLQRIASRLIEIEIGRVEGIGWVAVGLVRKGLRHEVGMSFMAVGPDSSGAEGRLASEIEVYFD